MKRFRSVVGLLLGASATAMLTAAPAHASTEADSLAFHVRKVELVDHGAAARMTFSWGCAAGTPYSRFVEVAQFPPVTTGYVAYDDQQFLEGVCDGKAHTFRVRLTPSSGSTPGLRLVRGPATEYLGGTVDTYTDVEVAEVSIKKACRDH